MPKRDDPTVKLPKVCEHGNELQSIKGAIPGSTVYDPGCRNMNKPGRPMRPHRVKG